MSYIRAGHELEDFEGESELYVFWCSGYDSPDFVEDYDADYEDNASLAQLLLNFIKRSLRHDGLVDERYVAKMRGVLAKKLNVKERVTK
jgi:hypothetical protein